MKHMTYMYKILIVKVKLNLYVTGAKIVNVRKYTDIKVFMCTMLPYDDFVGSIYVLLFRKILFVIIIILLVVHASRVIGHYGLVSEIMA